MKRLLQFAPVWARWLAVVAVLAAVAATSWFKGYEAREDKFDALNERFATFKANAAGTAERQRLQGLRKEEHDKKAKGLAEANLADANDALSAALDGLRNRAGGADRVVLPGPSNATGLPAGTVCFNRERLGEGLRAAIDRFNPSIQGCGVALNEGEAARAWAKAVSELVK